MIPVDTLRVIQETAVKAKTPEVIQAPDPRRTHVVINGELHLIEIPPSPRAHVAGSLEALVAFALHRLEDPEPTRSVIWHGPDQIVLVLDDADRIDRMTLSLRYSSPAFDLLVEYDKEITRMPQPGFVRMLRHKLELDEQIVQRFRRLNWAQSSDVNAEVGRHKESLGTAIMARVNAPADELPERIAVPVYAYETMGCKVPDQVFCQVDVDVAERLLALVPEPGEIRRVIDDTQVELGRRILGQLDGADVPVFYGSP